MSFDENVKGRYIGSSGVDYHGPKRDVSERAYSWIAKDRARKIQPHVKPSDVVLEVGVGSGWNLAGLDCQKKLGHDLSAHLRDELERRDIEFVKDMADLEDGSIDVCICHHMLEHVPSPPQILAEIHRLLASGGTMLLFVPYEREKRYRQYNPDEPNHHLYSWNVQTLANLVADHGYRVEKAYVGEYGYDRFASKWAERAGFSQRGFSFIRKAVHAARPVKEVRIVARRQ